VTSVNGLAGSVANSTTTPAITLSTSVTGVLKGNGTAVSAAAAGTDYLTPSGSGAALTGITASQAGALPSTDDLSAIAAANATAAAVSMNNQKITLVAYGSGEHDAATYGQIPAGGTTVTIGAGGTGQTTAAAAYNALSPMTTTGDLEYESAANTASRLAGPTSSTKQFLTSTGTGTAANAPAWGTIASGDVPTLNQSTSGTAAGLSATLAIASGGTNATSASAALTSLGAFPLAGGTLTGYMAPAVVTLSFVGSGTTLVNAALGNAFILTLTASTTTLGNPSNPVDGQVIRVRVIQDATGSRTLAYGTAYDFGTTGAPVLTTTAAKIDILGFEYVASITSWAYLGSGLGF